MKLFSLTLLALCLPFGMTSIASALAPMVLTHPESQMIQTGASATLSVVVDVSGPLTYQWKKDGVDLPSSNSPTYALSNAQGTNAGSYTVVVTNADGSCEAGPAAVFVGTRRTVFVRATAAGSNNGTSWTNAYTSLTTALANALDGDDIWVAAGTYKPSTAGNHDATFTVAKFVRLFGGFNGTETALEQRNWNANVTTLSGDLSGNDTGLGGNQGDNSKRVVTISSTSGAVVNGFTIRGGSNTVPGQVPDYGAGIGILSINSSMRVKNCAFRWNNAVSYGGALGHFLGNTSSPLSVESCSFIQNAAPANGGGAIEVENAQLLVKDSYFAENTGSSSGAVTLNNSRGLVVVNSVFASNTSGSGMQPHVGAGALRGWSTYNANSRIYGCTMRNNTNTRGTEGAVSLSTSASSGSLFANSIVVGSGSNPVAFPLSNYLLSDQTISGTGNTVGTPVFVNTAAPLGADGIYGSADDGLALQPSSPGINAGSGSLVPPAITLDAAGRPRLSQQVDMGAYETQSPDTLLGDNILPNPYLERDEDANGVPDFWFVGGNNPSGASWTSADFVSSTHSLLVNDSSDTTYAGWSSDFLPVTSGNSYAIRFFRKFSTQGGPMRVTVSFLDAGNTAVTPAVNYLVSGEQANWEEFESVFIVPAAAVKIRVAIVTGGSFAVTGWLGIDDMSIAAVKPIVTSHPAPVVAAQGDDATFTVTAAGFGPLSYQWQKDGVDIPGATSSTFGLANAKPWHIGDYTVKVTDANGTTTSNAATLSLMGINSGIWRGIVNYWPFSNSSSDFGFTANHFVSTNAVTSPNRFNKAAESYYFDGAAWMVSSANSTITGNAARTVSFWMKHEDMSWYLGYPNLVAWGDVSSTGAAFAVRAYPNKRLLFVHGNTPDKMFGPDNWMQSGLWYHVVVAIPSAGTASNTKAYINGQEIVMNPTNYSDGTFATALTKFRIGTESDTGGVSNDTVQWRFQALRGWMDDIRVYNRALSAPEVTALYNAENASNNWRQTHFGSTAATGNAANDADPDGDGLKNLLEYALNLAPNAASRVPASVAATGGNLEYTYTRGTAAFNGGTTFQVEWSDDLTTWSSAGVVETLLSDDGTYQQVKATLPAGSGGRRFVRLRVQ